MFETTGTTERPSFIAAPAAPIPATAATRQPPRPLAEEIDAWFRHVSGMNGFADI